MSHKRSLGLPFRNNQAARSRNGVVGNTGKNIPIVPSATHIRPKIVNIYFIIVADLWFD